MKRKFITTTWQMRTYEVWGNAREGYTVNNTFAAGETTLRIPVTTNNAGTRYEFDSATPTDRQIRKALGWSHIRIETEGDDLTIYASRSRDAYPIGELHCTSHASLSPIRTGERINVFSALDESEVSE